MPPTVLLVQDDPDIGALIAEELMERGLGVRSVADDRAAQRLLEREADQIAALVADMNLGACASGFEVVRRARRLNPRIEVIYVSGDARRVQDFTVEDGVLCPQPFDRRILSDMVAALAGVVG